MLWFVNGEFISQDQARIVVEDQGLLHGLGLFETILVRQGKTAFLPGHLERLASSAAELNIDIPFKSEISNLVEKVISCGCISNGAVRITLTAGETDGLPGLVIAPRLGLPYYAADYDRGWKAAVVPWPRCANNPIYRHKTISYAENVLARRWARLSGYDEGLSVNTAGHLTEGTITNLFVWTGSVLKTPPLEDGLLAGIVRGAVLQLAVREGIPVEVNSILPSDLTAASEAFLTNSLIGLMPLVNFQGSFVEDGLPGHLTSRLRRLYLELMEWNL